MSKNFNLFIYLITHSPKCGGNRTRTYEPEGGELQSPAIATMRYPQFGAFLPIAGRHETFRLAATEVVLFRKESQN